MAHALVLSCLYSHQSSTPQVLYVECSLKQATPGVFAVQLDQGKNFDCVCQENECHEDQECREDQEYCELEES
jgi:hypothetical protein